MALFLFRFWPALVPLLVYGLWLYTVGRRVGVRRRFRDGPWYWAVLASLLIGVCCFIVLGTSITPRKGEYIPPHMEQGKLVPGRVGSPP